MSALEYVRRLNGPFAVVAVMAGIAAVAGSYFVAGFTPRFVVAPMDSILTKSMPGFVVTFGILVLGDIGQKINLIMAIGLTVLIASVLVSVGALLGRRYHSRSAIALFSAVFVWLFATLLTGRPMYALGAAIPAAAVVTAGRQWLEPGTGGSTPTVDGGRRTIVASLTGLLSLGALSYYLRGSTADSVGGAGGSGSSSDSDSDSDFHGHGDPAPLTDDLKTEADEMIEVAHEKSLDVARLKGLVSEKFYEVDINSVNPTISEGTWELKVTGAVEQEVTIGYEEIRRMEAQHQFSTLRCVGESLNGRKMDNALWTGIPIMEIVGGANPQGEYVMLRAHDNYFEEFPMDALRTGFLAYGMNGFELPRAHGFPVRALIPGHWGEINVKWLTEIEILEEEADGYWEKRGWHGTGPVNTVAKLHATNVQDDRVELGGHAYAGTRGIEKVEVSIDGGDSWTEADLSDPLPDQDTWRMWVHRYDHPGESHDVVVRATDGTGTLQPKDRSQAFPSGATGWVSETIQ
ncbi:MAG: molybdopterin-dependent oxidoreductase [Halobacteriales archaeon]